MERYADGVACPSDSFSNTNASFEDEMPLACSRLAANWSASRSAARVTQIQQRGRHCCQGRGYIAEQGRGGGADQRALDDELCEMALMQVSQFMRKHGDYCVYT